MDLGGSQNSNNTRWLTSTNLPYSWQKLDGSLTVKKPIPISNFTFINNLLSKVNSKFNTSLNSCLIHCLNDGSESLRLHSDDEDSMDPKQPIVVITIGAKRKVDFLRFFQHGHENPVLSLTPSDGEAYAMLEGCQTFFKHRVLRDHKCKAPRYSLSFRRLVPVKQCGPIHFVTSQQHPTSTPLSTPSSPRRLPHIPSPTSATPQKSTSSVHRDFTYDSQISFDTPRSVNRSVRNHPPRTLAQHLPPQTLPPIPISSNNAWDGVVPPGLEVSHGIIEDPAPATRPPQQNPTKPTPTTVVFGTSMTKDLVGRRLGHANRKVINMSKSGATINSIRDMVDSFKRLDENAKSVDQVALCFGTNDIKNAEYGVGNLEPKVLDLVNHVKKLFPKSKVLLFSVLPMKIRQQYTVRNCVQFNNILRYVSRATGSFFIDCFDSFLSRDKRDINTVLYRDDIHLNKKGIGVFCTMLKCVMSNF